MCETEGQLLLTRPLNRLVRVCDTGMPEIRHDPLRQRGQLVHIRSGLLHQ